MSRQRPSIDRSGARRSSPRGKDGRGIYLLSLLFLFAIVYLWGREQTLAAASQLETLQDQHEVLQREVDRLELEMADLRGSGHVVEEALRLGLVFPDRPIEVIAVSPVPTGPRPSVWTYLENALVMAVEGLQGQLSPRAWAREVAPSVTLPDTTGSR